MRLATVLLLGLSLLGPSQTAGPADDQGAVVARAGEVTVSAEAFRQAYAAYLRATGVPDRPALRRAVLDDLVAARLLAADARASGIAATPAYQFRHEQVRRKLLLVAYTRHTLFDTLAVREAAVRAAFVRAHTRVRVRHLYARTREEAEVLRARLAAGETFDALARDVFQDPTLAETGGDLGEVGFDEMDPQFEEAAFTLDVGEISAPVQTAQGFSIIRVDERRVEGPLTEQAYAAMRGRLVPYVRHRQRLAARRAHAHALREALAPAYHDAGFVPLLAHVTGQALVGEGEAFEAFLNQPLVSFEGGSWTVADFREEARFSEPEQRAQIRHRADLEEFIDALIVRRAMLDRAAARRLDATPAFAGALAEAMDAWIVEQEQRRLAAGVVVPEEAIRKEFEAAPEGEWMQPARVHLHEIVVATRADADALKPLLTTTPFETLAADYSLREATRPAGGLVGWVAVDDLGAQAETIRAVPENSVVGPFEVEGQFVLLRVDAREPARPMTFEEAQPRIREQLRFREAEAVRAQTYEQLRARHPAEVDTELLYSLSLEPGPDES